jgi:hypothetical protein
MLHQQHAHILTMVEVLADPQPNADNDDVVALWRAESSLAALRFVDRLLRSRDSQHQ